MNRRRLLAPPRPAPAVMHGPPAPPDAVFGLRVLASGSGGNCSLLYIPGDTPPTPARVCLIDAGISPSRARALLAADGIRLLQVDDLLFTHLDRDHAKPVWGRLNGCRATRHVHARHVNRAQRDGLAYKKTEVFTNHAALGPHVSLSAVLCAHDDLGVAVFRLTITTPRGHATLGFATDVGAIDPRWTDHLAGVDILAIESNYCPTMQAQSARPAFLKQRITGGSGHLSNHQAAEAIARIRPRAHVCFLHLSRECNTKQTVADIHAAAAYRWTITDQFEPSPWIWAAPSPADNSAPSPTHEPADQTQALPHQHALFTHEAARA